jgi:hypothetical protein
MQHKKVYKISTHIKGKRNKMNKRGGNKYFIIEVILIGILNNSLKWYGKIHKMEPCGLLIAVKILKPRKIT